MNTEIVRQVSGEARENARTVPEQEEREKQYTVIDETTDSYLIGYPDGDTDVVKKNPTNELLYDEGMYDFFHGENVVQILRRKDEGGYIAVAPTQENDVFTLWVDNPDRPIITDADSAFDLLEGVKKALNGEYEQIKSVYEKHLKRQARPSVVNQLLYAFPVEETEYGWRIDDTFLLTWENEVYQSESDMEEDTFVRSGDRVEQVDSRESIKIDGIQAVDSDGVSVEGLDITFTETEVRFLATALWLIDREEKIDDETLWKLYTE